MPSALLPPQGCRGARRWSGPRAAAEEARRNSSGRASPARSSTAAPGQVLWAAWRVRRRSAACLHAHILRLAMSPRTPLGSPG
eukprot:CAMPEP_0175619074 /NCGR_PEP_ID=MMETSP0096-20121207/67225_1 /TAXON_ID=311494 /ORGANISM="Alexandrium monilatum, Strain CCMP3105" /LENGTH=82 /DNA_ID=CAMNT_0016924287 /DNA_START=53 /DNA_END=298 /DNA_ORIENTATION=+